MHMLITKEKISPQMWAKIDCHSAAPALAIISCAAALKFLTMSPPPQVQRKIKFL
jgi:hypothetical protein